MTFWQWITKSWPLQDERDAMARIGARFLWCGVPYFAMAALMERFGDTTLWNSHRCILLVVFIPMVGGLIDWRRLQLARTKRPAA